MTLEVKPYEWQVHKRNAMGQMKVVASRKQVPLSIGHAFTCHRVQGITLDRVIVDCRGMFGEGQFYTAVSRVKTKEGLVLRNFSPSCIKTNQACVEFYRKKPIDEDLVV